MPTNCDRVNVDLLTRRAREIRGAVAALSRLSALPREQFLADQTVVDAAKYRLVVAAEAAISICTHLAARLARTSPNSYAQCFEVLEAEGILSKELAQRMGNLARFRNLLVHGYAEIDDSRVWDILQSDLGDLDAYLSEVGRALGEPLS